MIELHNWMDEFNRLALRWEQQARACSEVRAYRLGDGSEETALLNRQKVFERCSEEIRCVTRSTEEVLKRAKQQTKSK